MLTERARTMVDQMCASLDKDALAEVLRIARGYYDARARKELEQWRKGQRVEVKLSASERAQGTIISVNSSTLTIDLGRRRIRCRPTAVRIVE